MMDGSNDPGFQSIVILGLKTALIEAQEEIFRVRKERDDARKKALQLIQSNSKFHVEVINSNQLATKLKSELKKVRHEIEELKKELTDKEHDNINLGFKVKELKSLLDIKTEVLESLNIKGDKVSRDEFIDCRSNYKILMRSLKLVIKNQPCYPDNELLEDIQNIILKAEKGKSASLSKYLVRKPKSDEKESNRCDDNDDDEDDENDEKNTKIHEDSAVQISPSKLSSDCFENKTDLCSETPDLNVIQHDRSTKTEDVRYANGSTSPSKNLLVEKTREICDEPVINASITDMPDLQNEQHISVVSPEQKYEKDIGTISDSESDKTSGFCDTETEAESPTNLQLSSHTQNTPSPENHASAMCMPGLLSADMENTSFKETCNLTAESVVERNTTCKISDSISNSKLANDNVKSPSSSEKNSDTNQTPEVSKILQEWKELRSMMTNQVSSLKPFYRDISVESSSRFKRPTSFHSSHRESVRKTRNETDDTANFIPKRASTLVKRDPNSRKKTCVKVDQISDNECEKKKRDSPSPTSEVNNVAESFEKSNLDSQVQKSFDDFSTVVKFEESEKSTLENSSSLLDVTSDFESLTPLLTEDEICDIIETKDSSNEAHSSQADDEVAAVKIETPDVCKYPSHDTNVLVDDKLTNESENPLAEALPCVEPVASVSDVTQQNSTEKERGYVASKSDNDVRQEQLDAVLLQKISHSLDESPSPVLTNKSNDASDECLYTRVPKEADLSIDKEPKQISIVESNNIADDSSMIDTPEKVSSVVDETFTSQPTDSSTSEPKKKSIFSEHPNESPVLEKSTEINPVLEPPSAEEKVIVENAPKKRGRPRKASSVTSSSSSVVVTEKPSPETDRRSSLRSRTAAQKNDAESTGENLPSTVPTTKVEPNVDTSKSARRSSLRSNSAAKSCDAKTVVENGQSSNTMNNGMERRKRKGNFDDILDSLKSKSKRQKTDNRTESLEQSEDVKPLKRRGRKRKTLSPIETLETATLENLLPRSESKSSQNGTSDCQEICNESKSTPKSKASPKNLRKRQQTNNQPSPVVDKTKSHTCVKTSDDLITAESENHVPSSVLEPCNFVPSPFFEKLIGMSKMIQEKVSTVVESRLRIVEPEKVEIPSSEKENIPNTSLRISHQLEAVPTAEFEHASKNNGKSITKPGTEFTLGLQTTPATKLKRERVANSSDSSSECKNDVESREKSATSTKNEVQIASSANLEQNRCRNPSNVSESSNDERSILKPNVRSLDENPEIVSNSLSKLPDDGEVITESNTNAVFETEVIPSSNLKLERVLHSSPRLQNDESINQSNVKREVIATSMSEVRNDEKSIQKSIFDSEDDESPVKILSKKVPTPEQITSDDCESPVKNEESSSSSDDEAPIEVPFRKTTAANESRRKVDKSSPKTNKESQVELLPTNRADNGQAETMKQVGYEEEFSNSSGVSSRASELDANAEMISQFENVRTPPKVKGLFDSTDDEDSKTDVFSIIEEMTSFSRCLLQRKRKLTEFSQCLFRKSTPSPEPVLTPPIIPSLEKYQVNSPSRSGATNDYGVEDEDDSEDEMLVIAEDDLVNDNTGGGIENNRFSCHDTNYSHASPAYTQGLKSSSAVANRSCTFTADQVAKPKTENENQTGASNAIKFEFYKENGKLKDTGTVKTLSPFESIWENLKSLHVRNCAKEEGELLMSCYSSVLQLAFFYKKKKTPADTESSDVSVEPDRIAPVEKLIDKYLENVRQNEYVAMKDFKMSANANAVTIADAFMNTVLKNAHRLTEEVIELARYLTNLCVDLEEDHKNFISQVQTTLRNRIFMKTWWTDHNVSANQVNCTIAMSILYAILSQRTNNVRSVRDLLVEGLCSFKFRAHPIAFGVLSACLSIFNDASRNCLLTQIMFFSLLNHSMDRNLVLYKVMPVRDMIGRYYKIKLGDKTAEDYAKEAMLLFDDDTWVDAVVLLCKRKQFAWSYTNVIMKYLVQILVKWKEHNFSETIVIKTIKALHKILLSCPMKAVNGSSKAKQLTYNLTPIFEILSDLQQIPKASRQLQETIAVTVCGISHLNFEYCSKILSNWEPPEGKISNSALEEMNQIMHRYRTYKPNAWLRVILPKDCKPRMRPPKRDFVPRKPNGECWKSPRQQYKVPEKNPSRTSAETPKSKKKKKKKSKKNRDNREQKNS